MSSLIPFGTLQVLDTIFLTIIVILGAALVLVSAVMLNVVKSLKNSVIQLEKRIDGLQSEIYLQQRNLDAIKAVLQKKSEDPFSGVLHAVDQYKSRGLWPAIAMVGIRLFRSYLSGKASRKALPK